LWARFERAADVNEAVRKKNRSTAGAVGGDKPEKEKRKP